MSQNFQKQPVQTFILSFWQQIKPFFIFFISLEALLRLALIGREVMNIDLNLLILLQAFGYGLIVDTIVFLYVLVPYTFFRLCVPHLRHMSQIDRLYQTTAFFIFSYAILLTSVGEWFFWDEFQSRYNFIAVDYLIYTQEVINNIVESYPVVLILAVIAILSTGFSALFYDLYQTPQREKLSLRYRLLQFSCVCLLATLSFFGFSTAKFQIDNNVYINEIAQSGIYELFSAYRHNELPYDKFYQTKPVAANHFFLRSELGALPHQNNPLLHHVTALKLLHQYNLVLITVESLSADFLKTFGNTQNLTPHLDALAKQSLLFTNLYATGTRTVYGLSALTLGMPPVPGNSIVRRPGNDHLFSLGSVLQDNGYTTKFIYGGYGYFDNMNSFFAGNGYDIVDRSDLGKDEIHFANAWGVSDDDLYDRVIVENDKAATTGKPFFDMIMTTSNHRPFTYPDGKIDIKSHSGRAGAVKFTDYTIHEFLDKAKAHSWFKDTIFVIVADHTAGSAGKTELDPTKYHIPLLIYAPGIVASGKVDAMASQIDVAPTVLGLMGITYDSQFYGKDVLQTKPERAFVSNYQKLGYMTPQGLVVLKPVGQDLFYQRDSNGQFTFKIPTPAILLDHAIAYFQTASEWKAWSKKP